MNIACFILGAIFGTVGIIVISCLYVASEADRKEEKWYEENYMEDSKDDGDNSTKAR